MSTQTRFTLAQSDIPKQWYNLLADFPEPLPPPLHPGTKQPIPPEALLAIFPENLVQQEMCPDRWVEVPTKSGTFTRCGYPRRCCARCA